MTNTINCTKVYHDPFWRCVKEIGWPCDIDTAKVKLMGKYSFEEVEKFRVLACKFALDLDAAVKKAGVEIDGCGDDGYSDARRHIVGLGKEEFLKNIENPQLVQDRISAGDYQECFTYCFPYKDDYDKADPQIGKQHFIKWAKDNQKMLDKFVKMDLKGEWLRDSFVLVELVTVTNMATIGELKESLQLWNDLNIGKRFGEFMKLVEKNIDELPHKFYKVIFEGEFSEHSLHNFYGDLEKVMTLWEKE